jgi:hypothetical protein
MTKHQRKYVADLQAKSGTVFTRAELSKGNHLKLYLETGTFVITGGTPSDKRAFQNCVSLIRRIIRSTP